jgi:negative regulator of flagellin synthesis FlgM
MRIDANQPISNQAAAERVSRNSGKSGSAAGTSADGATFSADRAGVGGLEAQVLATPAIREDRVAALRESIRNGSYQVDPGKIADAMLKEAGR